jgi:D-alanyl-lipoteichoic acid acyltransferase DltB (MBOAT superfamily)
VDWLQTPLPRAIWPILGSMFMFRLIVYMYDLKHQKEPANLFHTLSYFFLLPNVVFPLFPIVDFSAFRRTYYDDKDPYRIYQTGVVWMFWGTVHLILYRFVNYYLVMAPEDVTNIGELVQYAVSNVLLLLRVSGQFHLAVGILHLFGFNLPRTMRDYLLSSSFTDFWRRANIYWKDFMLKIFYYPAHFQLRRFGPTSRLVLATLFVFFFTWFLHAYQWFWLRGSFLLTLPDISFWLLFGIIVLVNLLYETKYGRKRVVSAKPQAFLELVSLSLRSIGTFAVVAVLFSLWISTSLGEWFSTWSVVFNPITSRASLLPLALVIGGIFLGTVLKSKLGESDLGWFQSKTNFFNSAATNGSLILLVLLIGFPGVYTRFGQRTREFIEDLKVSRLSDRDSDLLLRGYYENLISVGQFNSELWEVYTKKPSDWPLIQETELAQFTDDFLLLELVPSKSILYHGKRFSTNRWGMRDKDYEQIAPPDTYRAVLLGPSFVMGSGVADDEMFDELLEEHLNRENAGEKIKKYEILNFGVAGYSALQELAIFETRGLSFKPDAVFYVAHQLDEEILVRNLANRYLAGVDIPYDYLHEIRRRSGVEQGMTQVEAERLLKPFGAELVSWTYRRLVEISAERGITPVWIFVPTLEMPLQESELTKLTRLAEEANFIVLDLSGIYENLETDRLIVAVWDKHPNASGHRLIAEQLYQALRENAEKIQMGLPPDPSAP